jgi:hypothetical protein
MNAVVRALEIGTRFMSRTARLPVPLDPAVPAPSWMLSKTGTRRRALQWTRKWTCS